MLMPLLTSENSKMNCKSQIPIITQTKGKLLWVTTGNHYIISVPLTFLPNYIFVIIAFTILKLIHIKWVEQEFWTIF